MKKIPKVVSVVPLTQILIQFYFRNTLKTMIFSVLRTQIVVTKSNVKK